MRRLILGLSLSILTSMAANATESGYTINNYQGRIGNNPVHLSIQNYAFGPSSNIEGSYYYDKYRSPIALYGKRTATSIELCEVNNDKEYDEHLLEGKKYDSSTCPLKLTDNGAVLQGNWQNKKHTLPVSLTRTDSLTQQAFSGEAPTSIEIPFWGQTALHSFIGVYQKTEKGVSIDKVKVLNKKTGNIDQIIDPQSHDCDFGFYMTAIYQNIEKDDDQSSIILNCYSNGPADNSMFYRFDKKSQSYQLLN